LKKLKELRKIEIGVSITQCDHPYIKTRVLKFTQRYVFINKLNVPLVLTEPSMQRQVLLRPRGQVDWNFTLGNPNKQIRLRLPDSRESARVGQRNDNEEFGYYHTELDPKENNQDLLWSYRFSCADIDDFQISLKKNDPLE